MRDPNINETISGGPGTLPTGSGDVARGTGVPRDVRDQGAARQHHRRLLRWMLVAAPGVTAALLAGCSSHAPSVGYTPAPLAEVTSALAKTSANSYSFSLESVVRFNGSETHADLVSGAFDPRNGRGTELLATKQEQHPVSAQIRFIGRYVYTRVSSGSGLGKPWNKAPLPPAAGAMPGYVAYGFVTDQPVSPDELSGVLRSAGTVREAGPASGPGWTGTRYTFTAALPRLRESLTATVYIDQQGHVRRLVTITKRGKAATERDIAFSAFGATVRVTAPSASQVKYTSYPYRGFLF